MVHHPRSGPALLSPAGAARALAASLLPLLFAACGGGIESATGGGGEPGTGGGVRGPGETGNPLAVQLEFTVKNHATTARTETITASVPFPEGGYFDLDNVVVSGHQTAWHVMQRWPDGSVRIAQAQFTDELAAGAQRTYRVARDVPAETGAFTRNGWVEQASALKFGAEVHDTFGVRYRAFERREDAQVLRESPLVQVRRHRLFHQSVSGAGIGRDYLTSTFYVTEFRDVPVVVVDWVLGNDYLGADTIPPGNNDPNLRPLGGVDVNKAQLLVRGATGAQAYRAQKEFVDTPVPQGDGYLGFEVLKDTFLGDGQTRRYRFLLYTEHPNADPADRVRWRDTAAAMLEQPIHALATHGTWSETAGAGLLGGPVPGPADAWQRAEGNYQGWENGGWFAYWGSRGDPLKTGTTGTPRNHPLSPELAHAIQAGHHRLLIALEQKAWAQAMRPYHLYGLRVGAEQDILLWDGIPIYPGSRDLSRESLGRRALYANDPYAAYRTRVQGGSQRAHGWEHFDHEHWSTDLLFDYWTISGDEWAKEELRQLGQSLKGLMRLRRYSTSFAQAVRAEGWCMQGFVQVYLATGDESTKDYALRRLREVIVPGQQTGHPSRALGFQGNYLGTRFPLPHQFFMPWQHGAALYGFLGAYKFFEDPEFMRLCEEVVTAVEYSWVTNYQDPNYGLVENGLRYYTPVEFNGNPIPANFWDGTPGIGVRWGDSPLGGANTFLIGGLHFVASWSPDPSVRQRALNKARILYPAVSDHTRWSKWYYCTPEWMLPQ